MLTGYLHITDLIYNYRLMLNEKQYSPRVKMSLNLALARMGDSTAVSFLKGKLAILHVNDNIVYEIFPLLTYTRQRAAFDFLLQTIQSEEKNCLSSNPDKEEPIICAYRIIEMVAPYIHDFPAKIENRELVSDDYSKTLMAVKEWIKEP
ncbi:MAG: hypothetical protein HC905_14090 [Bacteroidales bacterium]|nr:hypothetical protein [Bacteroidales bacterium]